jgi:hypothetical protein
MANTIDGAARGRRPGRPKKTQQITSQDILDKIRNPGPVIDAEKIIVGTLRALGGTDKFCEVLADAMRAKGKGAGALKSRAMGIMSEPGEVLRGDQPQPGQDAGRHDQ